MSPSAIHPYCSLRVGAFALLLLMLPVSSQPAETSSASDDEIRRAALTVAVDLASDAAPEYVGRRSAILDALYSQISWVDLENLLSRAIARASPDEHCSGVVAARGELAANYLAAIRRSYACYLAAQAAGQREQMSVHLSAGKKYAELAAKALNTEAAADEAQAASLGNLPFAVRRSPERAQAFLDQLRRGGLTSEHTKLLVASGLSAAEIDAYRDKLLATAPGDIGVSIVEFYDHLARFRRALATALDNFASGAGSGGNRPLASVFTLVNPHDRDEDIDLLIRRVSIPPDFQLAIVDAPEATDDDAKPPPELVEEVVPGEKYRVHLPARGETRIASVVVPVGAVGENTTARWAVEGRIGDELIGGMMHEMNVPATIPDLKLPPIAPLRAPGPAVPVWAFALGAAAVVALAGAAILLWRRRRARAA